MIEKLQKEILSLKIKVDKEQDIYEQLKLQEILLNKKLELVKIIRKKDKARAGLTARELITKVDSMPRVPKYEIGMPKVDAILGGFETGLFINLGGESGAKVA